MPVRSLKRARLPARRGVGCSSTSPNSACPAGSCFRSRSLLLALAAADSPALAGFFARRAGGDFGPAGLCVHGDRRAGAVRRHRQAADRPRAAVRGRRRSVDLAAVRSGGPTTPAFRPATPPRRLPRRSRSARSGRGRGRLMWIYAVVIAISRVVVTAHHPSDVIAGAIVGRHRRAAGAQLVRRAPARLRGRRRRQRCARLPGPSWRRIKAVARRLVSA